MERDGEPKKRIPADVARHFVKAGAPLPTFGQLSEGTDASRQLIRYYFDQPEDMLLGICDHLA